MRCSICHTYLGMFEGEYTSRSVMKKKPNKCPVCGSRTPGGFIKLRKGERYYKQNVTREWGR